MSYYIYIFDDDRWYGMVGCIGNGLSHDSRASRPSSKQINNGGRTLFAYRHSFWSSRIRFSWLALSSFMQDDDKADESDDRGRADIVLYVFNVVAWWWTTKVPLWDKGVCMCMCRHMCTSASHVQYEHIYKHQNSLNHNMKALTLNVWCLNECDIVGGQARPNGRVSCWIASLIRELIRVYNALFSDLAIRILLLRTCI